MNASVKNCRKILQVISVTGILFYFAFTMYCVYSGDNAVLWFSVGNIHFEEVGLSNNPKDYVANNKNISTKYILYWTPTFGSKEFYLGLGNIFQHCEISNCFTTYNKTFLPVDKFDALMFHGAEYTEKKFGVPDHRNPNQIYIFSTHESPIRFHPNLGPLRSIFNWTMTYRLDSDIQRVYGYVIENATNYKLPSLEFVKNKTRFAAWFVSNCYSVSRREEIGKKLQKLIPVDVYGRCGNLSCSRHNDTYCYDMLENDYKFYLAFENSYCHDYVTEKLFKVLKKNVIPVVYGGADYNTRAPPNSVINIEDFDSLKDLANYLKYLNETPHRYLKYFEWKKYYIIDDTRNRGLCNLCRKLNEPIEYPSSYENIEEWWWRKDKYGCKSGSSLPKIAFS